MTPNADIIRSLLIALGLGAAAPPTAWPVYVAYMPGSPDNVVVIYDTSGRMDGRLMATGQQITHPGVQIQVRGVSYPTAFAKAQAIAEALDVQRRVEVVSGEFTYTLHNISRTGDVLPMGIEQTDRPRHLFSVNAVLTVTRNS